MHEEAGRLPSREVGKTLGNNKGGRSGGLGDQVDGGSGKEMSAEVAEEREKQARGRQLEKDKLFSNQQKSESEGFFAEWDTSESGNLAGLETGSGSAATSAGRRASPSVIDPGKARPMPQKPNPLQKNPPKWTGQMGHEGNEMWNVLRNPFDALQHQEGFASTSKPPENGNLLVLESDIVPSSTDVIHPGNLLPTIPYYSVGSSGAVLQSTQATQAIVPYCESHSSVSSTHDRRSSTPQNAPDEPSSGIHQLQVCLNFLDYKFV
jgi:hypothetical protein